MCITAYAFLNRPLANLTTSHRHPLFKLLEILEEILPT